VTLAVDAALIGAPVHWERLRWKAAMSRREVRNLDLAAPMVSLRSDGTVVPRSSLGQRQEPARESLPRYLIAAPGDLVVNPMWLTGGAVGVSTLYGAVSPDYRVFRSHGQYDSRYLHHLLRSKPYLDQYKLFTRADTTFDRRVQQEDLDNLPLPLPPLSEQHAIAVYLDREVTKIDVLTRKQERLIETLRERRESLVARTLLRGLDPLAPTTSVGSDALGQIPAHWSVVPTRHLCTITTGDEDSGNATEDGDYPFYVRGREILRIGHFTFDCEAVMTPGDGQGGTGKVFHYMSGKFVAHQRVYVFSDFRGILGWYFYYFLSTFLRPVALAGSNTVTMESLRRPLLANFKVAVPPLHEQHCIAAYLDAQTSKIDALVEKAEKLIEVSKERRSALITAAVIGQIDVRDMADDLVGEMA
jgi:type I restriction enzyme S subunit